MRLMINNVSDGHWAIPVGCQGHDTHGVRLVGSLDEHTVSQLRELSEIVFDGAGFSDGDHFLIDVSEVTEIDHVGIAALVGITVMLAANAGSVSLILPMDHPIRHTLQVTGLDRIFDMNETTEAANRVVLALRRLQVEK